MANKMKVQYYKDMKYGIGGKRLVRVTATLLMSSERRGIVENASLTFLDDAEVDANIKRKLIQNEIGRGKNISSCYSAKPIENTDE